VQACAPPPAPYLGEGGVRVAGGGVGGGEGTHLHALLRSATRPLRLAAFRVAEPHLLRVQGFGFRVCTTLFRACLTRFRVCLTLS